MTAEATKFCETCAERGKNRLATRHGKFGSLCEGCFRGEPFSKIETAGGNDDGRRASQKRYRLRHPERLREARRKWREKNRKKIAAYQRRYRAQKRKERRVSS